MLKDVRLGLVVAVGSLLAFAAPAAAAACLSIAGSTSPVVVGMLAQFSAQCCVPVPALASGGVWLLGGVMLALGLLVLGRGARRVAGLMLLGLTALLARPVEAQSCGGAFHWVAHMDRRSDRWHSRIRAQERRVLRDGGIRR